MASRIKKGRGFLPEWLNFWVVLGAFLLGLTSLCFVLGLLLVTRGGAASANQATAILSVIHADTETPISTNTTPQGENTLTPEIPPSPPPGEIEVGAYVQVTGTGGDGLRLRIEPGLDAQILKLGSEAEVFRVQDGPREIDGYTWWYLVGPFDSTRYGWAVANYLVIVQGP
jgi:hypothetical protein